MAATPPGHRATPRRLSVLTTLSIVALMAAACGTDNNPVPHPAAPARLAPGTTCGSGTISGAGSTFVASIVSAWVQGYQKACPQATINYQPVGSGAGIQQLIAKTVDFAGSDVVLKPSEAAAAQASGGPTIQIPWTAGAIAVEFHLTGVSNLHMSPATLAGIFAGRIKNWSDQAVRADNPGLNLPDEGIQVIHRSDGSGTTAGLTAYMKATAPDIWTYGAGKDVPWPTGQGAKGSDQVTAGVEQTEGAIGYAEVSYAQATGLHTVAIRNPSGAYVLPSASGVAADLASATIPANLAVKADFRPQASNAYPISTLSWVMLHPHGSNAARQKLLASFVAYALGPGQQAAAQLFYAPLPPSVVKADLAALAQVGP